MKTDDLENELRNLRFAHLTEDELVAYCDQELDNIPRLRVEAHIRHCFICSRQLALLQEESAALSNTERSPEDVALVERLMEQGRLRVKQPSTAVPEAAEEIPLREQLAEYLRQMAASWRVNFAQVMRSGESGTGEEVWHWQSEDGRVEARAVIESNADMTIHFTSSEPRLQGARINFRLGPFNHEIILQRVSESEIYAKIVLPPQQRQGILADVSIESV